MLLDRAPIWIKLEGIPFGWVVRPGPALGGLLPCIGLREQAAFGSRQGQETEFVNVLLTSTRILAISEGGILP